MKVYYSKIPENIFEALKQEGVDLSLTRASYLKANGNTKFYSYVRVKGGTVWGHATHVVDFNEVMELNEESKEYNLPLTYIDCDSFISQYAFI